MERSRCRREQVTRSEKVSENKHGPFSSARPGAMRQQISRRRQVTTRDGLGSSVWWHTLGDHDGWSPFASLPSHGHSRTKQQAAEHQNAFHHMSGVWRTRPLEPCVLAVCRGQEVCHRRGAPQEPYRPAAEKMRPVVAETGVHNVQVIKSMVAPTEFIWDCRYGRTESKNFREAAIKSKQRQKNESMEDSHGRGLRARYDDEVDRGEDSTDKRGGEDTDPATLDHTKSINTQSSIHAEGLDRQDNQKKQECNPDSTEALPWTLGCRMSNLATRGRYTIGLIYNNLFPSICMILDFAVVVCHIPQLHVLDFEMNTPSVDSAAGPQGVPPICCVNLQFDGVFTSFLNVETSLTPSSPQPEMRTAPFEFWNSSLSAEV